VPGPHRRSVRLEEQEVDRFTLRADEPAAPDGSRPWWEEDRNAGRERFAFTGFLQRGAVSLDVRRLVRPIDDQELVAIREHGDDALQDE
jgi:hypothetical protein